MVKFTKVQTKVSTGKSTFIYFIFSEKFMETFSLSGLRAEIHWAFFLSNNKITSIFGVKPFIGRIIKDVETFIFISFR